MAAPSDDVIVVTGAGGFIGRRVCAALASSGRRVLGVDVRFAEAPAGEALIADLTDEQCVIRLFEQRSIGAVVHLASLLNSASRADPFRALQVNLGVSARLLERAARLEGCRFVYGSSISAYGSKPVAEHGWVSEAAPAAASDIYGVSKRFVELAGETLAASRGLEFVALRIPVVVGPGAVSAASRWRSEIFELLAAREPVELMLPFPAAQLIPLAHVQDVARAVCAATLSARPAHTLYNTPAENLSCGELANSVRSRNERISVRFGDQGVDGIPQALDSARFSAEFAFEQTALAEHLDRDRSRT